MKKGDLALSTSAIVALIVAIIVLGFIIVFAVRGFGSLDEQLEKEAMSLAEPQRPTSVQPLTISTSPTATIGGDFFAKVSVYNNCPTAIDGIVTNVLCTDTAGEFPVTVGTLAAEKQIMPGQTATLLFLGTVDTVPQRSICTVAGADVALSSCPEFEEAKVSVPVEFVE